MISIPHLALDRRRGNSYSLLHMDGTNGSQVITDTRGHVTWAIGGASALDTSIKKFGTASYFSNGSASSFIASSGAADANFNPSVGDWTAEIFANFGSTATSGHLLEIGFDLNNRWMLYFANPNHLFFGRINAGAFVGLDLGAFTTGQWYHLAVSRRGTDIRVFVDGVLAGTSLALSFFNLACVVFIGSQGFVGRSPSDGVSGHIDEFQYTTGAAVYWNSPFTPPTLPFL
jgi:hypothetical protein